MDLVSAHRKGYRKAGESVWVGGSTHLITPPFTAKGKEICFTSIKSDCPSPVLDHNGKQGRWSSSSWYWRGGSSEAACLCSLLMCVLQDEKIGRSCRGVQQGGALWGWPWGSIGGSWACFVHCAAEGLILWKGSCKDHWMWTICSSTRWQQPEITVGEVEHEFWPGGQCVTGAGCLVGFGALVSGDFPVSTQRIHDWYCYQQMSFEIVKVETGHEKNLGMQQHFFQENLKIILCAITLLV